MTRPSSTRQEVVPLSYGLTATYILRPQPARKRRTKSAAIKPTDGEERW